MKNYRLRKEAVPFFNEKYATAIYGWDTWNKIGVDDKALEVVEDCYVTFGHRDSETSKSLAGWSDKDGSRFLFTIYFPSVKFMEHDKFAKGKVVRELMNIIQSRIDSFYSEFINGEVAE